MTQITQMKNIRSKVIYRLLVFVAWRDQDAGTRFGWLLGMVGKFPVPLWMVRTAPSTQTLKVFLLPTLKVFFLTFRV
jgi:hypothetical protein